MKKHFILLLAFSLLLVFNQPVEACSIQNLKGCDRLGIVQLIKDFIIKRQGVNNKDVKSKFQATEIVVNNLPNSIEFWTQAYCPNEGNKYDYVVPDGYRAVDCSYGVTGSHSGCKTCVMSKITLEGSIGKPKEVFLSQENQDKMIHKMENELGYLIRSEGMAVEGRLFKGSFQKSFQEGYLLIIEDNSASMTYAVLFLGLFDKNMELINVAKIGGITHSLINYTFYSCNKNGLNLILVEYLGCSNGAPFCKNITALKSFNDEGIYDVQELINSDYASNKFLGEKMEFYQWKLFEYSGDSYDESDLLVNKEECIKKGCKDYWFYEPYMKSYLLLDKKMAYDNNACKFITMIN